MLKQLDIFILFKINAFGQPHLNTLMQVLSSSISLICLVLVFLILEFKNTQNRKKVLYRILATCLILIVALGSCDFSTNLIKHNIKRLRPSHDIEISNHLNYITINNELYRGGLYGFFSSHAANTACCCMLLWYMLHNKRFWVRLCLIAFTFFCGYSRIYMGVHYPSDVAAGWCYGMVLAGIWIMILNRLMPFVKFKIH